MEASERKALTIIFNTNKTVFEAQKSNRHRLNSMGQINKSRHDRLENISIAPFNEPLYSLRNEMENLLMFSSEYMGFLSDIDEINIYDSAELIVEIGDIRRFKNRKHFLSYAGLSPVVKNKSRYSKVKKYNRGVIVAGRKQDPIDFCEDLKKAIIRCTSKLINTNYEYKEYYESYKKKYQYKHPRYNKKRIHLMSLKKTSVYFAKKIYHEFRKVAEIEDEMMFYDAE